MRYKKAISGVLMSSLLLAACSVSASAYTYTTTTTYTTELSGQWYENAMNTWISRGVIGGDEFGYRAESYITRGELATMIDRIMEYQIFATNMYYDLGYNKFYTAPILGAVGAGIITGDTEGTMRPEDYISREETTVILARLLNLDDTSAISANFIDQYKISNYAVDSVNALYAKGYITGDEYGFRPYDAITRAEVATMLTNMFPGYMAYAGTYSQDVLGNCVISESNVTLSDMTIYGSLIIAEGVAEGDVTLDDVIVTGDVIIRGGGENTVAMNDTRIGGTLYMEKLGYNGVHVTMDEDCTVSDVNIKYQGILEADEDVEIDTVNIESGSQAEVTGTIDTMTMADGYNGGSSVTIGSGADIDTLEIDQEGSYLNVNGTVDNIDVNASADDMEIYISSKGDVDQIDIHGEDAEVDGKVDVYRINVYGDGAEIDGPDGTRVYSYADDVEVDGSTLKDGKNTIVGDDDDRDRDDENDVKFYAWDSAVGNYTRIATISVDDGDELTSREFDYVKREMDSFTGYTFNGWYTVSNGRWDDKVTTNYDIDYNTTVYAQYSYNGKIVEWSYGNNTTAQPNPDPNNPNVDGGMQVAPDMTDVKAEIQAIVDKVNESDANSIQAAIKQLETIKNNVDDADVEEQIKNALDDLTALLEALNVDAPAAPPADAPADAPAGPPAGQQGPQ